VKKSYRGDDVKEGEKAEEVADWIWKGVCFHGDRGKYSIEKSSKGGVGCVVCVSEREIGWIRKKRNERRGFGRDLGCGTECTTNKNRV